MTRTQAEAARICAIMANDRFGGVMPNGCVPVPEDASSNRAAIALANEAFRACNRDDCMTDEDPHFGPDWAEAEAMIRCGFR